MQVTMNNREYGLLLFGVPILTMLVVLLSMYAGHLITKSSDRPTNVTVTAAAPHVDVNVPKSEPVVNIAPQAPTIAVNVPQAQAPEVHVSTPAAQVTVIREEKATLAPIPVKAEEPQKTSAVPAEENLTLDTLYKYAERYIRSYCEKNSTDYETEQNKWLKKWQQSLQTAINDGIDADEQAYLSRIVIQQRDCFDIEKAAPEKICQGCRLLLRYRDGRLELLQAMKDALTGENIKKTMSFLAAGVK